ncbi:class I SAM-dependent methyltransferase [uncultured Shewanella sp.]|uniref:class I SAM-dependent methyltransferase n=1 Tax=uncultured Shewanella sp. TaxID=173975 RepID=UPI00261C2D60|nr:class I SAM-dependent methyltransferase [uncultured Shewanella sp.]
MTTEYYNDNAELLARQYLSTTFEEVHSSWLPHLDRLFDEASALSILDVGAGIGRDAAYLARQLSEQPITVEQRVEVVAVEPAHLLADLGKKHTKGLNVTWIVDSLPRLNRLAIYQNGFNLILLSAVWMHIPEAERTTALQTLAHLLAPNGRLVITLRHGPNSDTRIMHPVSVDEMHILAKKVHLEVIDSTDKETDKLGRTQVFWQTVVLERIKNSPANKKLLPIKG